MNDQDKFTERIFVTVREMYTLVKNMLADIPTSQDHHAKHIELEATPPRFDKILSEQAEKRRLNALGCPKLAAEIRQGRMKSYFSGVDYKLGSHHRDNDRERLDPNNLYQGPTMIDTKSFKLDFLSGDKNAVMYNNPNEAKTTQYATTWKGIQVAGDYKASILDNQWQSFVQQTVPDPSRMTQTQLKFNSIEKDRIQQGTRMGGTGAHF